MTAMINELRSLCAELRSEKPVTRNKAAERLDNILANSKSELITLFRNSNRSSSSNDISCSELFNSAIEATLKHAAKVEESQDAKGIQTMLNKNHIFRAIVSKLIEYNLENDNNFLTKPIIFNSFIDGINNRSAMKHFSSLFLNLLERGIYKSPSNVRDIKVNEYSRILSYLFEVNVGNDDILRFDILKVITKTIELAFEHVQISIDIIAYLPEIAIFAHNAQKVNDDRRKAEVIKLFYLFLSQLTIDYHHTICNELQDLLPVMCDFFHYHMKTEVKQTLFHSIYISLYAIYPHVYNGDFSTINVTLKESWTKTLKKLKTIVDIEIKERKLLFHRPGQASGDKCYAHFIKMSAVITYLIYWHVDAANSSNAIDLSESCSKIAKLEDKLEIVLSLVQPHDTNFNETWFAILTEMICNYNNIINISNYQQVLQNTFRILHLFSKANNLLDFRLLLTSLLQHEQTFLETKSISAGYCQKLWAEIIDFLLSETSSSNDVIVEKQFLLQALIAQGKFTSENCTTLLQTYMTNTTLRRNECIETVRQMLIFNDQCGLDKTSQIICRIITWAHETNEKIDAKNVLLNIAPLDAALVADTCAIAVINFLNEKQIFSNGRQLKPQTSTYNLQLLLYKYNRKLVCLEEHSKDFECLRNAQRPMDISNEKKNSLLQCNYELLMRALNFEPSKDSTCSDILLDLSSLQKIVCLMKMFLHYGVFDEDNFTQCPLIKRIGFFLSHLEFQLKNNIPRNFDRSDILEILHRLEGVFNIFTSKKVLLEYLEKQPLEELTIFLGNSLKFIASQINSSEFEDWSSVTYVCLRVLATLCSSATHQKDAFSYVSQYQFNIKTDLKTFLPLIRIFCSQKSVHSDIANWFVEKLKNIFRLYYTNVEIVNEIVEMLPDIFTYIQEFQDPLENMIIALISLLKIAYKKSYSVCITSKLINSIRLISRHYKGLHGHENFTTICLSIVKFLPFPSFEIQIATINTLTALMDVNWLASATAATEAHFNFCQQLFLLIDWKSLLTTTLDLKENSKAITIQVFASLLVFSSYYQEMALQELAYFCALRKLTEADLYSYQQIACHFKCTISELTAPYVANLIHTWIAKQYPIFEFPYFLCANTKDEFFRQNLKTIVICLLLYSKADKLKKLNKYASQAEILELALPFANAFVLPYRAECPESKTTDYKNHIRTLKDNLNVLGIDLLHSHGTSSTINWETIYYAAELLRDDSEFQNLYGFPIFYQQAKWFQLNYKSLKRSLSFYINKKPNENDIFSAVITKCPLNLVHTLGELKRHSFSCLFYIDKLIYFYKYCTIAELIIDSIPTSRNASIATQNCAKFFVRDAIFFILHYSQNAEQHEFQRISLTFLRHILNKPMVAVGFCNDIIKDHLNDITKALVATVEKCECPKIQQLSISIMHSIIIDNHERFEEAIALLDEFPMNAAFSELREVQGSFQSSDGAKDLSSVMRKFLRKKNRGIASLKSTRQHISKNKSQLQQDGQLLYELIKRLIEILRSSTNMDFSIEAAKCLSEIGSLRIEGASYYFETETSFYDDVHDTTSLEPMPYFIQRMLITLEKLLLVFNTKTQQAVCNLALNLTSSKHAEKLLNSFPYFKVFHASSKANKNFLDTYASMKNIDWITVLKSTEALLQYDEWICMFVSKVFENCNWDAFQELASQDSYFADASLQPFIKLLMHQNQRHLDGLIAMLEYFFEEFCKVLRNETKMSTNRKIIFKEKRVVCKFLNICEYIRMHNQWIVPVNLLLVVKACNYCQAYFMSIMYLELWALDEQSKSSDKRKSDIIANEHFQEVATKAYQAIGCNDSIAGFLNPLQSRLNFLNLNNNWSDILLESDCKEIVSDPLYASILKRNGMLSLASLNQSQRNEAIDYEVCWRLCQWDTTVEGHSRINSLNDMEREFEKHHFNALKSMFNREEPNILSAIDNARHCVLSIMREISVECLQSVYKYLTWLQLLQHVEDFCQVQFVTATPVNEIFGKWQSEVDLEYGSFSCKEQILSHQIALFNTAGVRANRKIKDFYKDNPVEICMLKCIKECKNAGSINLAKRNIATLRNMEISQDQIKASMLLEDADICLKTGKPQITQAILQHILKTKDYVYCLQRIQAYRMYGEYLLETNMESFEIVLRKFFNGAMELLEQVIKSKEQILQKNPHVFELESLEDFERSNRKSAYETIAKYADREYTQLNTYANSDEFQMKCKIMQQNRQAAENVGKQNKDRDKACGAVYLKKFANLDEQEMQSIELKRTENLCIAVENYMKYCKVDETASNAAIYRIIALWFSNKQNESLHAKIKENIAAVPSYKFICALNQITARLNSKHQEFINVLKDILVQCTRDHPHHTLYHLYPLVFAFKDGTTNKDHDRVSIAKEIIAKSKNKTNGTCIKQLESMFPALIDYANFNTGDNRSGSIELSDKLKTLKNLDAVQSPTINLPVSVNKEYYIISVVKWENEVSLVGGINAPKKLKCLCSDGIVRPQLLKGKDDLRQDAVMQQTFAMINDLLRADPEATERKLKLRTYKVVPLSMRSGILEWCENTIPVGMYLSHDGGAHKKYRPDDYLVSKCRQLLGQHLKSDIEKRYQIYKHICEKIKPVFHYFFLEKFLIPGIWFERRLAYTNSVATTSIIGFIVGLGDRHTQNILIDEKTAEVIHIDFGIAFEQGKIMPTPETVPFRLTRDIVAPMGVCETNGVFKKSCETTMRILRQNQSVITTILEVLLYDPLYIWKVVPQIETTDDGSAFEEKNLTAQRALLSIQNKLEGKQTGVLGTSSVDVQVQRLINDAMSSRNLCRCYHGWDPYM